MKRGEKRIDIAEDLVDGDDIGAQSTGIRHPHRFGDATGIAKTQSEEVDSTGEI